MQYCRLLVRYACHVSRLIRIKFGMWQTADDWVCSHFWRSSIACMNVLYCTIAQNFKGPWVRSCLHRMGFSGNTLLCEWRCKFRRLICRCQERCSHLASDVAKLQRAAAAARRGQLASVKAMHSANAAKVEVTTRPLLLLPAQSFALRQKSLMSLMSSDSGILPYRLV